MSNNTIAKEILKQIKRAEYRSYNSIYELKHELRKIIQKYEDEIEVEDLIS